MTIMKHTSGPWHVEGSVHILDSNRTRIADVCDRYDGFNNNLRSSAEANANLISEAPTLLALLEAAVPGIEYLAAVAGTNENAWALWANKVRASINRARGN